MIVVFPIIFPTLITCSCLQTSCIYMYIKSKCFFFAKAILKGFLMVLKPAYNSILPDEWIFNLIANIQLSARGVKYGDGDIITQRRDTTLPTREVFQPLFRRLL